MSHLKKVLSLIIVCTMITAILPFIALADEMPVVYLTVENTTFSEASGAAWDGKLLDSVPVEITTDEARVADIIIKGLGEAGYTQIGAEDGYISDINGLGEFAAGLSGGWMISLNDWFTSAGISEFYVSDGDCIALMYTTAGFGEDLGGTWSNNNKKLKQIEFSEGTLSEEFSPDTYEYTLTLPAETDYIKIIPTAANKNFQTRIYLNTQFSEGETGKYIEGEEEYESVLCGISPWSNIPDNIGFIKRTNDIPVKDGDVISVACGLPYWNSMNNGEFGSGAEYESGSVYTFIIEKEKKEIMVDAGIYDYTAVSYKEKNTTSDISVSENGIVYETENYCINEETSVLEAIKEILNAAQIEYNLDSNNSYITDIGGLSEMDCGNESGWTVSVNDKFLEISAAEALLQNGDKIKLHYSVEGWGTDVGNYFTGGPVLHKITLGGTETTISSNTVYADENDWTGTTTYYIGEYTENGVNTPIEGNGSYETPFIISIKVGANVDISSLCATISTSLHERYLNIAQGEGLADILSAISYENDVTFGITTPGKIYGNYYTVKVSKETSESTDSSDNNIADNSPSYTPSKRPGSSGGTTQKEDKEDLKEEAKEDVKEETDLNHSFEDTKGHWAENYIGRLAAVNIINGKSQNSFAPDDRITRAEFVTLLYRLSGMKQEKITDKFSDISENDWYAQAISWAEENKVASGMSDEEFKPDEFVNREQSAVFLIRFCELMKYQFAQGENVKFTDEDKFSEWSRSYILKAEEYGIINGFEDGSFSPDGSATRAQCAKMLCSMLDNQIIEE